MSRENGECIWGAAVVNKCFGLGAEQLNSDGSSKSTKECQEPCCATQEYEIWQQQDGRGCYYNKDDGIKVLELDLYALPYEGARKCIPDFCGSPEEEKPLWTSS